MIYKDLNKCFLSHSEFFCSISAICRYNSDMPFFAHVIRQNLRSVFFFFLVFSTVWSKKAVIQRMKPPLNSVCVLTPLSKCMEKLRVSELPYPSVFRPHEDYTGSCQQCSHPQPASPGVPCHVRKQIFKLSGRLRQKASCLYCKLVFPSAWSL